MVAKVSKAEFQKELHMQTVDKKGFKRLHENSHVSGIIFCY